MFVVGPLVGKTVDTAVDEDVKVVVVPKRRVVDVHKEN